MNKEKTLNIIKKVLWGIAIGVFGLLLLLVLWLAIDKFIIGSPVPSIFGYSTLTVETGSMSGTIEIGDMIIIKDTGEYKIGDIVTFLHEGESIPTTHRIINYNSDGSFVTKGDANNVKDTLPVTSDEIIGEVVKIYPKVGLFGSWVREEGWLYIVAVLAIIGIGAFILKEPKSEDEGAKQKALSACQADTVDGQADDQSDGLQETDKDGDKVEQGQSKQD